MRYSDVFKDVFSRFRYLVIAGAIAVLTFSFAVLMQNFGLIWDVWRDAAVSIGAKLELTLQLFGGIATNFTLFTAIYTVLVAVLFGLNVALMTFYLRKRRDTLSGVPTGTMSGGLVAGILGVGCAACGSMILTAVLPLAASGAVLAFLPLGGGEFGVLAVVLLVVSLVVLARRTMRAGICEIPGA